MAGVFELVDVGPDFGLPAFFVGGGFAAGGAAGVEGNGNSLDTDGDGSGQFHEDAADFLNFFVFAEQVLVAQQVAEAEFLGFRLGLARV